jgi:PAS domain S-box-containing protein
VLATAGVAAFRFAAQGALGDVAPFLPFTLAVVVAAWYGGAGPGLLATVLGAAVSTYLFVPPPFSWRIGIPEAIGIGIYLVAGVAISTFAESLHAARRDAIEKRQRAEATAHFLRDLERCLRAPDDPTAIELEATRLLGRHLGADRCFFNEIDVERGTGTVVRAWEAKAAPSAVRTYQLDQFVTRELLATHSLGETTVVADADSDPRTAGGGMAAAGFRSFIAAPCAHHGNRIVALNVTSAQPRVWREDDAALVRDTAARLWPSIEHARALRELKIAMGQLRLVTDAMSAPVTRCNRNLEYVWVSNAYAEWMGLPPEQIAGRPIAEIFGREASDQLRPYFDRVLAGERVEYEEVVRYPRIGERWIHSIYTPTHDAEGRVDGWVGVVIDVHERRKLEDALRDTDRRKDEFLAMLAHELRNPLAPIRHAVEILKTVPDGGDDGVRDATLARDVIDRQVSQLTRLVDDLLDVSRISRNKLELRREPVELAAILESSVETSRPHVEQGGHRLTRVVPGEPIHLDADPVRLAQIFSNLLNNAAKYTPPGGHIRLEARRVADLVEVSVKDDGAGLDAEQLTHLFDTVSRGVPLSGRSGGGLGIGLSLVKSLVDLHGGSVEAKSGGVGAGSEFVVRLPAAAPPAARAEMAGQRRVAVVKRRVLVVDDNADSADMLATLLRIEGHQVEIAYDGASAIAAIAQHAPELVLLDLGMPDPDGYEVCRGIRSAPWGWTLTIVAVTGWGQEEDRRRTERAGFDRHLVKPVAPEVLSELLASLDSEPRVSATGSGI